MKHKHTRSTLIAIAAGLALCASAFTPAMASSDEPYIAIVSKGFSHQYWQAVKQGAEQKAQEEGARITFVGPPTESDVAIQINQLTTALQKKPDVLGFAALDSRAAAPMMMQAKKNGIPVIAFDSGVDSSVPAATVATDNKKAAAAAAMHMAELLDGQGTVGLIIHDQTSTSGIDRRDGFVNWMEENAPNIKLLKPHYISSDMRKAANVAKAIIASNPDIDGIYASNEAAAQGLILALRESGKKGITGVGFDSGKAQIDAVKSGLLAGAITQSPFGMGEQLVEIALKVLNGEDVSKHVDTGFSWYDKSNINDPEIQRDLYK